MLNLEVDHGTSSNELIIENINIFFSIQKNTGFDVLHQKSKKASIFGEKSKKKSKKASISKKSKKKQGSKKKFGYFYL